MKMNDEGVLDLSRHPLEDGLFGESVSDLLVGDDVTCMREGDGRRSQIGGKVEEKWRRDSRLTMHF